MNEFMNTYIYIMFFSVLPYFNKKSCFVKSSVKFIYHNNQIFAILLHCLLRHPNRSGFLGNHKKYIKIYQDVNSNTSSQFVAFFRSRVWRIFLKNQETSLLIWLHRKQRCLRTEPTTKYFQD